VWQIPVSQRNRDKGKYMNYRAGRFVGCVLVGVGCISLLAGCASMKKKEVNVSVADLSAAARTTVERVTKNGKVDQITKEKEKGKVVYDVEATINGKHEEFLIADSDGEVLGTESSVDFSEVPQPVREAAQKYFGTSSGLKAMKGIEYGKVSYEIEGPKNGKTVEITFDEMGQKVK